MITPAVSSAWLRRGGLALVLVASAAVGGEQPAPKKAVADPSKPFDARLLEIARTYRAYGPVDQRDAAWAPGLCRAPIAYTDYTPGKAHASASKDSGTHGQKLYFLFAQPRSTYLRLADKPNPVGLAVVKESWTPRAATETELATFRKGARGFRVSEPFASKGGKLYRTDQQGPLFIMVKLKADTPGTDNGWVYGTVTPDGKKVTSVGRVASCMECHRAAKHDRLFGYPGKLPPAPGKIGAALPGR